MRSTENLTSYIIIPIVLIIAIGSCLSPSRRFSNLEGRALQQFSITPSSIKENFIPSKISDKKLSLAKQLDNFFSDQIIKRDSIVSFYNSFQIFIGKKKINNIYIGKDNYLFNFTPIIIKEETLINSAKFYNKLGSNLKNSKLYLINLPSKNMVYEDKVPIKGYKANENYYVETLFKYINPSIRTINVKNIMNPSEDLYYKTDHHWNMTGAFKAYTYIIEELNKDNPLIGAPNARNKFKIYTYEKYFLGSDGRSIANNKIKPEDISIYKYPNDKKFRFIKDNIEINPFDENSLSLDRYNNDYSVYLGGDGGIITVENLQPKNNLSVAIIGDSMDNPLISLFADHFKTLYSYDIRHFKGNLYQDVKRQKTDIVILIGLTPSVLYHDGGVFNLKID